MDRLPASYTESSIWGSTKTLRVGEGLWRIKVDLNDSVAVPARVLARALATAGTAVEERRGRAPTKVLGSGIHINFSIIADTLKGALLI